VPSLACSVQGHAQDSRAARCGRIGGRRVALMTSQTHRGPLWSAETPRPGTLASPTPETARTEPLTNSHCDSRRKHKSWAIAQGKDETIMIRACTTYLTDLGPVCPECGQEGLWGYALTRQGIVIAQCGSCHTIETFDAPGGHPTAADLRYAHHEDRNGGRFRAEPVTLGLDDVSRGWR